MKTLLRMTKALQHSSADNRDKSPTVSAEARNSRWQQKFRSQVVEYGIRVIWGAHSFPAYMAADISLLGAGARMGWLRILGACGVKEIVARSGLGHDFVCHIGDLAEYPYYHRRAFQRELAICTGWLLTAEKPVVCDVGANVGFFATQLVQILQEVSPEIYAFEPVPTTFAKLVRSVERLGLTDRIHLIQAAVLDAARPVTLSYSDKNSLYAQIVSEGPNLRAGDRLSSAKGMTLDGFCSSRGIRPTLLKIDVEGYEVAALRGARHLLTQPDRPALVFEYFPKVQRECGVDRNAFKDVLSGYALHYIDDLQGQRMPLGSPISGVEDVPWGCNLFAVPLVHGSADRWARALTYAVGRTDG